MKKAQRVLATMIAERPTPVKRQRSCPQRSRQAPEDTRASGQGRPETHDDGW